MIFIIPLQDEIDTALLPFDAPEFSKMPKSQCKTCGETLALQALALHVESRSKPNSDQVSWNNNLTVTIWNNHLTCTFFCVCENMCFYLIIFNLIPWLTVCFFLFRRQKKKQVIASTQNVCKS